MLAIVGKKCGMTRVFNDDGVSIPVTVIETPANRIVQIKQEQSDGYNAVQITIGQKKNQLVNKPEAGHFTKASVEAGTLLREFRLTEKQLENLEVGGQITVDQFEEGQWVDISGISKGKGFAGTVKRHHFRMQDATHGNSLSHRAPGSIGQCQTPGRVFKGKKMAGHMGSVMRTIQNQRIIKIDKERQLLLIKGAVPGAPGSHVVIKPSIKKTTRAS